MVMTSFQTAQNRVSFHRFSLFPFLSFPFLFHHPLIQKFLFLFDQRIEIRVPICIELGNIRKKKVYRVHFNFEAS